jgi:cytochrome P450
MTRPHTYDPSDPAFQVDPYPTLVWLREHDPLHVMPNGVVVATRHADVAVLLRDPACARELPPRLLARVSTGTGPTAEAFGRAIIARDPPVHTRLRRLMAPPFRRRLIERLRGRIAALVEGLLHLAETGGSDVIDIVGDVALLLPYQVNCDLLGLPVEEAEVLRPWVKAIERVSMPFPPRDAVAQADAAVLAFRDYMTARLDEVATTDASSVLAMFADARDGDDTLTREEVVDNAIGLFPAGAETVTGLIGNVVLSLLDSPDQLVRVRRDRSLVAPAIEESLRLDSPINAAYRWTIAAVEVPSGSIRQRRLVVLSLAGANRDPAVFVDPDRFDVLRDSSNHVALGAGRHVCLGEHLGRLQADVTLNVLLDRYGDLRLAGAPERLRSVELRGLARLPVQVVRRAIG